MAVALATIAIAATYLVSNTSAPPSPAASAPSSPTASYQLPVLGGALAPESGPDGMAWQWIGRSATVRVGGFKRTWLAFRALSAGVPRTLSFRGQAGEQEHVRLQTRQGVYLVGPLAEGLVLLRASPQTRGSRRGMPSLAVFLSTVRGAPNPVAAVPGSGFWSTESAAGVVFNWMRGTGLVDVYAPGAPSGGVWLTFIGRSLGQDRSVTAQSGRSAHRTTVTTTARAVRLGPFPLAHGRARIVLKTSPGPRRYGLDPRSLSIQVANLGGFTSPAKA
jgi:hypothetical protein